MTEPETLAALVARALADVAASASVAALEEVRVHLLGKKGQLTERLKALGALPPSERPIAGRGACPSRFHLSSGDLRVSSLRANGKRLGHPQPALRAASPGEVPCVSQLLW